MKQLKRRRLLQAGLALGGASLVPGRAALALESQAPPGEKSAQELASNVSLIVAPRRALVIGNSKYRFGPLRNPANDAQAIAAALKQTGFEVALGVDLPRAEMLAAVEAYGRAVAQSKAVGLFYFAGHGVQLSWRNYLLPTDAELEKVEDIPAMCVDVNAVIEGIAKAANPMNVIVLDACRDNPFTQEGKVQQKGLSQLDAPADTLLAYATAPGNVASDGAGSHGLYTEALLREILVPEAKIEDVFKRVRLAVRRGSNGVQIPWESTSLEGDFWFIPPRELKKLADEEAERQRQAQEAERQRQAQEAERLRKEKEELERIQREEKAEQQRQAQKAERAKQQEEAERARKQREAELEAARQRELDRIQKENEAERARQEALERQHREQLERAYQEEQRRRHEELERAYKEESEFWTRVSRATEPGPLVEYLQRYPSGHFAEIAQVQLDRVLARQGEKKIEIAPQTDNPYTKGSASADTDYKLGDRYTYDVLDAISKVVQRRHTNTITEITEFEIIYDYGRLITDRLGNLVRDQNGNKLTANQFLPSEFLVGKRWETQFVVQTQFGPVDREYQLRISGKEQITVPAGTFDCFVIEAFGGGTTGKGTPMTNRYKFWLSPTAVRRPIAFEIRQTLGARFMGAQELRQLVSFKETRA